VRFSIRLASFTAVLTFNEVRAMASMSCSNDRFSLRDPDARVHLVGGGIASMAAAVFMIRDGDILGRNVTILEAQDKLGGSLDGAGTPEDGYVLRGGRMFESKYLCTLALFDSIPTLDGKTTVTAETQAWNQTMRTSSKARLMTDGQRETAPAFGLSELDILKLERILLEPEAMLGRTTIAGQFGESFFKTDFWLMWCTTFAFQPWHSAAEFRRYVLRFAHMVSGFNRLEGITRTVYNQYDSLVRPLQKWLRDRGVVFKLQTRVTNLGFAEDSGKKTVESISYECAGELGQIAIGAGDHVLVTLGSMTEGSSLGAMDRAPELKGKDHGGAWALWDTLAQGRPEFGNPHLFDSQIDASKWVSFTTTLHDASFLERMRDITGNVPGEGGLITFTESNWLLSMVIPYQPHFIGQPVDVAVFWGYGLYVDKPGNFVQKPMSACTGREIMTELLGHLHLQAEATSMLAGSICIPCMMPFITSQFLPRGAGDRPQVIPKGYSNLAFIGQFCELPDDVVFTVEYSIRSAQKAAYALLGIQREPPAVYKGAFDPRILFKAFLAIHDIAA
jgi:oleate hydratase